MLFRKRRPSPASPSGSFRPGGETVVLELDDRVLYEVDAAALADHPLVIGREKNCDWCTAGIDNSVSARHAELFRRRGTVWIRDLGSRNGLFFQGERVKEHRLAVGTPVLLGACKVSLEPPRGAKENSGAAFHRLEQRNGPESGRVFELKGDTDLVIGSDPGCAIFLPDTLVSRQHAKLSFKKDGSCWVSDLDSRNGTSVDGMAVAKGKERLLRDGNVLSVAYVEFRFVDKNAVHVEAHVGRNVLVVAATVACCAMGYSLWNVWRKDAGWYLESVQSEASRWTPDTTAEGFKPAFEILQQVAVARNAKDYLSIQQDLLARMESWTNTIGGWQGVRANLKNGKWVSAQRQFHELSSWTWNAKDAPIAHHEAEAVQTLVTSFLDARTDIGRKDWESGRESEAFRTHSGRLDSALANVPSPDEKAYLGPLVGEAAELRAEFETTLRNLGEIETSISSLENEKIETARPVAASELLLLQQSRLEAVERHWAERVSETGQSAFRNPDHLYFAPIVATRIRESLEPLKALARAERILADNIDAIAAGRWDETVSELKFPPPEVTDLSWAFNRYRAALEAKNELLCGSKNPMKPGVKDSFKTRIENLERIGFGPFVSGRSGAFGQCLDEDTLRKALTFVDETVPVPRGETDEPICVFDRYVGVFELGDFLSELASGASPSDAVAYYDAQWESRTGKSLVRQLREQLVLLRAFRRYPGHDPTGGANLVLKAAPKGGNRCKQAVDNTENLLSAVDRWRREDLKRICAEAGSERSAIFGEAVSLLLEDAGRLDSKAVAQKAKELGLRWRRLNDDLKDVRKRTETDPESAWREIVARGIPARSGTPFTEAWRKLREFQGQKGR